MCRDLVLQVISTYLGSRKGLPESTQLYIAGSITFPLEFISKLIAICKIHKRKRNGGTAYVHETRQKILNALKCISRIIQSFSFFSPKHPREPKGGQECTNMHNRRYV